MDYFLCILKADQEPRETSFFVSMAKNTTTAEEEVELGLLKPKEAVCEKWQEIKRRGS